MKYAVLILALLLAQGASAQTPKPKSTPSKKAVAVKSAPTPSPLSEKEQFAKASAHELAADRVAALEKFVAAFPQSSDLPAATDLMTSSRALIAEEKLMSGSSGEAVALFKQVVEEAPNPIPNELFNESISKIPSMLFRYNQRPAAFEMAILIESKVENNAAQLLEVANFYLNVENGAEAMRVSAKAAAKDPASAAVYRTIALAQRINFDLDAAANAYARALEIEPSSLSSKRGLAEMKRALGKSDEAAVLYRELLARNETDIAARTGLVLALFDAGKRTEAEAELTTALEKGPSNFVLLAGAAYWYASRGIGEKAVELAEKALAIEPRYVWSHIALARGLMARGKPVAAEQVLVRARAHGNFPTLEYELASARMASGFYRDAVEDLAKHFTVTDGGVKTNLGGRVAQVEKTLSDLVAYERKASIFTPVAADTVEASETLKALLALDRKLAAAPVNEIEIGAAVDAFVKGNDKMKLHRQIYAAALLLEKRVAIGKSLELTKAATGNTDAALEVPDPGAAVMASELYESRVTAFRKGEFLLVPEVPRPTLSAILRGRIEELTGWALYQQGNFPDSIIRLRRSISVMPDKSAWWRSSMWRLGAALESDGKDAEALNAYIESYKTDKPDLGKYGIVESLYRKINGTTDGLEAKIGAERVAAMPTSPPVSPTATPTVEETPPVAVPASDVPVGVVRPDPIKTTTETTLDPLPTEEVAAKPATATPDASQLEPKKEPQTLPVEKDVPAKPANSTPVVPESEPKNEPQILPVEEEVAAKPVISTPEVPKPAQRIEPETSPVEEVLAKPAIAMPDAPKPESKEEPQTLPVENEPIAKPEEKQPEATKTAGPTERPATSSQRTTVAKPLFEPIIITIPAPRPARIVTENKIKPADEKGDAARAKASSGDARPRVIDGQEVEVDGPLPCRVGLSQDNVSLINNGGTVGILANLEGPGDIKSLTAVSSSPKDVEVILEPEIGGVPDRRFFVIKSTSVSLGVYQVAFVAPCGKKELIVTVR